MRVSHTKKICEIKIQRTILFSIYRRLAISFTLGEWYPLFKLMQRVIKQKICQIALPSSALRFFASVPQPTVVTLFSFSVIYPTLVAVGEKLAMVTDTLCIAFFALHTGSNFLKPRPRWALNHRISLFEERYSTVTLTAIRVLR